MIERSKAMSITHSNRKLLIWCFVFVCVFILFNVLLPASCIASPVNWVSARGAAFT